MKKLPALSLIELLLVIALVAILVGTGALGIISIRNKQALNISSQKFENNLKQAHIFARDDRDQQEWGIKWDTLNKDKYYVVSRSGGTETVRETIKLERPTKLDTFSGGSGDVWFDRGTGNTVNMASWVLATGSSGKMRITVNVSGVVSMNPE